MITTWHPDVVGGGNAVPSRYCMKRLSEKLEGGPMKTTVKKAKGGTRQKTLKEEKRDIGRSLKSFGKKVASKLKGK
jgi:hypothetical protein